MSTAYKAAATTATGIITFSLGGVVSHFTVADVDNALAIMLKYFPIIISIILFYMLHILSKDHKNCRDSLSEVNIKLAKLEGKVDQVVQVESIHHDSAIRNVERG